MIVSHERVLEVFWGHASRLRPLDAIDATAHELCLASEAVAQVIATDEAGFQDAIEAHLQSLQEG